MTTLYLDLETYNETPITAGTHRYAATAEILLVAWALDNDDVTVSVVDGARLRSGAFNQLLGRADTVVIHNSAFDRAVLAANGIALPASRVHDTMVQALAHSLPGSLGSLCAVLGVPADEAKDKEGKRLIRLFCQPRPKNQKLRRATHETHPEEWRAFCEYARLDVEAMRAVHKKLPVWNCTPFERDLWLLDQTINRRGVQIDIDLAHAAIREVEKAQRRLARETQAATLGVVGATTQRDALLDYLREAYGVNLADLRGSTVDSFLQRPDVPQEVRDLLAMRQQASTTSTAKYRSVLRTVSPDGRLRGALQFCGASRTGRWAGRLFQPQNLPRPSLPQDKIDSGIEALKAGCPETVTDNVMELASSALRGLIVAAPGNKLVVADLSNIEGRVLAWLAGEQWKLDAFAAYDRGEGADLYKLAYARSFGIGADEVTKAQRQIGKVQELALGYEGGVGAFSTFAAAYSIDLDDLAVRAMPALPQAVIEDAASAWEWMKERKRSTYGLSRETWIAVDGVKRAWRRAHPATAALWRDLAEAVRRAICTPGSPFYAGRLRIDRQGAWLRILLPGGRYLCYPAPRVGDDETISYLGISQYTRQWDRLSTYGGKLAENVTQAVARDVLAHGMVAAERGGYPVVLSVHDELIAEVPDTGIASPDGLAHLMTETPDWAGGLPLAAAGFEARRYMKKD